MRKVLVGSAALSLLAGGFLLPKALAGTSAPSNSADCGDVHLVISQTVLWPPNHKMIPITITASENDGDGDSTMVMLATITNSDETGPNGAEINGSGPPDVAGADEQGSGQMMTVGDPDSKTFDISLSAERSGHDVGSGRTYTIPFTCMSNTEGMSSASLQVFVPHDMGNH